MVELSARTPCAGLVPLRIGGLSLDETPFGVITSVAPLRGQMSAVSAALEAQTGLAFPSPGRMTGVEDTRVVWSGKGQALVLGPTLAALVGAAMTDQSDAWACVSLEGPGARAVLARLTPIDLRPPVFEVGHVARTMLGHMNVVLMRTGAEAYGIMAFRSMAGTLVHDLEVAMRHHAARGDMAGVAG